MRHRFGKRSIAAGVAVSVAVGLTGCGIPASEEQTVAEIKPTETDTQLAEEKKEKPNIIYLVLDDMGFGDLGCYGSSIHTPNMDALAKAGIQYTNYNTCPMSSPARASLLTGFDSNFAGVGVTTDIMLGDAAPNIQGDIRPECAPISHSLRENGYTTMSRCV